MSPIQERVEAAVERLLQHPTFREWSGSIPWSSEDLLLVNNSFVFRDVRTTKSEWCVTVSVGESGAFDDVKVAQVAAFNSDFKRIPGRAQRSVRLTDLKDAVAQQVDLMGDLVYLLIGQIDDSTKQSVEMDIAPFDRVTWDPTLRDVCSVSGSSILVRETFDEESIWESLTAQVPEDIDQAALKTALGIALDELQDLAVAKLKLPRPEDIPENGVTAAICEILKAERAAYAKALDNLTEPQALNEVLRIGYNFASDATDYIRLIVSVCDLKPLVLWATIDRHYRLSETFRRLPWTRKRTKPSLKNYESTIKDARNSAFHNLFPFRKSLSVPLSREALGETELRIFSEHSKKKDNTLNYLDKPLVDVLVGFTRAREVRVSQRFWCANLDVMDATIDLFEATDAALRASLEA
jgi:hypothetical protein